MTLSPPGFASNPQDNPERQDILLCLSHLRWDFVYQRPQHLLSRAARQFDVIFFEEPWLEEGEPRLELRQDPSGVTIARPHMPESLNEMERMGLQRGFLDRLLAERGGGRLIQWFYTPMALPFAGHLKPDLCIYDCMDELSLFKGAPPALRENEAELFRRADLVFTGGRSLYESKRRQHPDVHCFPSSVDVPHFAKARGTVDEPADQKDIPHPRLGFFGVVDERMDIDLLRGLAEARPDYHLCIIGPVVKIDEAHLPRLPNIHYLGGKSYAELPAYVAGWDIALLPFARNDSTKFISPTKTPEYLAGGRPVISTPITDVVRPYGELRLVAIEEDAAGFAAAADRILAEGDRSRWLGHVDEYLATMSWDRTWDGMHSLMQAALESKALDALDAAATQSVLADDAMEETHV
ncbi:MAG TPA: glycosyltransferase family 1 protein [Alphaproteobacteria bacterium]|nr:glycosyltransferase family 1 protein [Alphaproteobacteria bacterium]